jgi:hypothetical protein
MRIVWLIQYQTCSRPAFIAELNSERHAYGVTSNPELARRFTCEGDARHEILRLGLDGAWGAIERAIE